VILLWGSSADGPLGAVHAALGDLGAPLFLVDQTRSDATEIELSVDRCVSGEIRLNGARCALADVSGAYIRCESARTLTPAAEHDGALARHADRLDALMSAFLEITEAHVINPAEAMATNGSKPYQSAIIAAHGLAVPETLVTTDTDAVDAFAMRHGQVIYKSISGVRSIVTRLQREDADRLAHIEWCPTQFQQYVPGRDYRVHVVGDETFAAEIVSDADDYRYAAREGEDVIVQTSKVPIFVEERCRALIASLGLVVAGIDLRLTPRGEWYCFEVNPSPAFTYYTSATNQPIAQAIARILVGMTVCPSSSGGTRPTPRT
jgi:glutathione synthase/RimK-type ligase-like ATP-grasp enzyme